MSDKELTINEFENCIGMAKSQLYQFSIIYESQKNFAQFSLLLF